MLSEKVSVVVPIYNVEKYLERCIKSIVQQTYSNLEIILVDDGSRDASSKMCDIWEKKDKRIKVIHKMNGGLSDARNVGIDEATGDYLFFVDSDDWIETVTVEKLLKELHRTDSDISCCGIKKVYEDGYSERMTDEQERVLNQYQALREYLTENNICTVAWNKLYKSELFNGLRYPKGRLNEDEFLTYKLLMQANKVCYTPNEMYNYFQRANSIMNSMSAIKNLDVVDAWLERIDVFNGSNLKQFATMTWIQIVDTAFYHKSRVRGQKELEDKISSCIEQLIDKHGCLDWENISQLQRLKTYVKLVVLKI